ncbi:MAG: hypothetical protein JNJ54_32105 [Myxococcaceae bacterium]|nr:hypothetical protein [Myxococcaceae bacterium]
MLSLVTTLVLACDPPTTTAVTIVPVGSTTELVTGLPVPDVRFEVTCPASSSATCNAQIGRVEFFHPSNPSKVVEARANGPAVNALSGTQTQPVPGSLFSYLGSTVAARVSFVCGTGLAVSSTVTTTSQAVVIPPRLSGLSSGLEVISWESVSGLDVPNFIAAGQVPANRRFTPAPMIHSVPRGGETTTVRVTGPGLDFTKAYAGDGGTDSFSLVYKADPAAKLSVTGPGSGKFWIEYGGARSEELTLTFVGSAGGGSAGGAASGGGSAGGGTEAPEPERGCGCSTGVDGLFMFAAVALVGWRRRWT